ncbi:unnamed protein product [Blepharisma stoltei]|uniref:B30.2/SPRY domain-containing protein n=1 Tax=Blepharisma stoltei TaxID=1481888 RepID=A0AAU9JDX4_9CILI|nr:unnamed protein product [Blepharisma stoltei]
MTRQEGDNWLESTEVYTFWGYGKLLEKSATKAIVKFSWGGIGYIEPNSISNIVTIKVKCFAKVRKLLSFDWDISHNFSNLFSQLKNQYSLPPGTIIKLYYPMGSIKEIKAADSPLSLKLKSNSTFIALLRQNFYFNENKKANNIEISNNCLTASKKTEEEFETVLCNISLSSELYTWEMTIDLIVDDDDVFIGVADENVALYGHPPDVGLFWGIRCSGGKKFRPETGIEDYFGESVQTGDVVGVKLEYKGDQGWISFQKNGKDYGVAYKNVPINVYPAVSLYYKRAQVSLNCKA